MPEIARVDLFGEDRAHELLGGKLVERVARDIGVRVDVRAVSSRGGSGRAIAELRAFLRRFATGMASGVPDLLVVIIDANDHGARSRKRELEDVVSGANIPRVAIGCPDPYVERWYCADEAGFHSVVGAAVQTPAHASRTAWKDALATAVHGAGIVSLDDGIDLGPELVDAMDLAQAGRAVRSLGDFLGDLRSALLDVRRGLAAPPG